MSKFLEFALKNSSEQNAILEERNKIYGDNFTQFGRIISELFPDGVQLQTITDWNRFGVFVQMISKLTRYAQNFNKGGHKDSLQDLSNYATIMQYLDDTNKEVK